MRCNSPALGWIYSRHLLTVLQHNCSSLPSVGCHRQTAVRRKGKNLARTDATEIQQKKALVVGATTVNIHVVCRG
ncbi:unnamed protein product [Dicrocoelium dendriticum]|nr:unnamed protein product [Dicrocoelium dendriticum]